MAPYSIVRLLAISAGVTVLGGVIFFSKSYYQQPPVSHTEHIYRYYDDNDIYHETNSAGMEKIRAEKAKRQEKLDSLCQERGHILKKISVHGTHTPRKDEIIDLPDQTVRISYSYDPDKYLCCERCGIIKNDGWETHKKILWKRRQHVSRNR